MKKVGAAFVILFLLTQSSKAQLNLETIQYSLTHQAEKTHFLLPPSGIQVATQLYIESVPVTSEHLIPKHIRKNPMGYAPTCLLELDIEKKLPFGVWAEIQENQAGTMGNRSLANLRFRFFLFP